MDHVIVVVHQTQVGSPAVLIRLARCTSWVKRWSEAMDFHAKTWPYIKNSNFYSKGMQKSPDVHAKIWPYIKNSNLHSKGMQKSPDFHTKIWTNIKNSNLHSKGMQKVQIFTLLYDLISRIQTCIQKVCKKVQFWRKNMTLYQEF